MLCSKCNKNPAILFFEKSDEKGNNKNLKDYAIIVQKNKELIL